MVYEKIIMLLQKIEKVAIRDFPRNYQRHYGQAGAGGTFGTMRRYLLFKSF